MSNLSSLKQLAYQMRRDNPNRDLEDCSQEEAIKMVGAYLYDAPGDAGELLEYVSEDEWSSIGGWIRNGATLSPMGELTYSLAKAFTTVPGYRDLLHTIQTEVDAEIERDERESAEANRADDIVHERYERTGSYLK